MQFNIITIFPGIITDYCNESILKRAQKNKFIQVNAINLRDFAEDKHKTVDDTPYGGGAGMVMKPEPIFKALQALKKKQDTKNKKQKKIILLSPRGRQFDERVAEEWAKLKEITFVCGRYEGVDQRVVDYMVDEEISIGPYVLAGGELGALVIIEAIARLIPGVLGNEESLSEETFNTTTRQHDNTRKKSVDVLMCCDVDVKEYPQYTKPAMFKKWKVPEVLLSGDHKKIAEWREKMQS